MKLAISKKNLWEKTPPAVKRSVGRLLARLPTRYTLGKRYDETKRFIDQAQWWDAERLRDHQAEQLRRILTLAYERAPYYKRLFDEAGFDPRGLKSPEEISCLPFSDRQTVTDNLDEMLTRPKSDPDVDYITTGGTSGKPLCFYTTAKRSAIEYAYLISGWERAGFHLGDAKAVFRGRLIEKNDPKLGFPYQYDAFFNEHYYSTFHMNDENMGRYLEHIRSIGPCFLHVYPSSLDYLVRYIKRSGFKPGNGIRGILAESENVYPEQRKEAEELLGCRYFSSYGHTEKLVCAAECEHNSDYHVWPTYGYMELVDEEGKAITTPGQRGEIVATGFINDVTPFVRYRTGDFATYVGERCPDCGRNHTIIRDIRGHNIQECLVARDESLIAWSALNMHDDTFDDVVQFQFVQERPGEACLRIVPSPAFDQAKGIARIERNMGRKLAGRVDITIEVVDRIPLSKRGKAIFVDQRIPGLHASNEEE